MNDSAGVESEPAFPTARQFALEWWIPDDFGGMTRAILRRSDAFAERGAPVDILTLEAGRDYRAVSERLRRSGSLGAGVRIRNIWDDLSALSDFSDTVAAHTALDASLAAAVRPGDPAGPRTSTRLADDGSTVLQVDHLRPDGSLLVTDRRDSAVRGRRGGRTVTLFDRGGEPVRSWSTIWALYSYWLDIVVGVAPAVVIIDSKVAARFAATYRRENVTTVHLIHNSHLATEERPYAPLRESRATVLRQLHNFDSVVVLTERQRGDIEELLGPSANLTVIPNSVDTPDDPAPILDRAPTRGVMLASLEPPKRIDHAIRAAAGAAAGSPGITLEIHGRGSLHDDLAALIGELDVAPMVRLLGYSPDARASLRAASFLLLTSEYEGFPLVLLEAMAAGCIPIAYDIPYGPADIIQHGRNGFLVPAGDERQLVATISALVTMPGEQLRRMRLNARATVDAYTTGAVTRSWAAELTTALRRKEMQMPRRKFDAALAEVERSVLDDGSVRVAATLTVRPVSTAIDLAQFAIAAAEPAIEIRETAAVKRSRLRQGRYRLTALFPAQRTAYIATPDALDLSVLVSSAATTVRVTG